MALAASCRACRWAAAWAWRTGITAEASVLIWSRSAEGPRLREALSGQPQETNGGHFSAFRISARQAIGQAVTPEKQLADAVEKVENQAAPQISRKIMFACRRFCKALSHAYEALWSPSCDSTWSLTSARAPCTGGAEKFGSPARKTFFDSIGHVLSSRQRWHRDRSTPDS
jgi:hypothetical protein